LKVRSEIFFDKLKNTAFESVSTVPGY